MCGIAGVFNFRTGAPVDVGTIHRMGSVQAHRGPDADGVYADVNVGLAHRRLAVIDLADHARQPMMSSDGRYVIVYNGEVYNYVELRAELEADGYRFRTKSDTEVLLTLYERDGVDCLQRLNGMFAFAIWDSAERTLFLARDRVGVKPLYWAETPQGLAFASEAKALFECADVRCEMAESLIGTYMTFGYIPGEETLFRGVRKLLPGHYLRAGSSGIRRLPYWDVACAPDHRRSADETAEQLHDLLLDAVRIHLRSDVPVGVFLSGGLDSSATVALLAETGVANINTFCVAYREGGDFDESAHASLVAERFHTTHRVLYVDPRQFRDFIPEYVWHMDEPVTEAAGISLYFVSKLLREHVVVALSGEGADELFGGYDIYRYMRWLEAYRRLPATLRRVLLDPAIAAIPSSKIRKYVSLASMPLEDRYLGVSLASASEHEFLYSADFWPHAVERSPRGLLAPYYSRTVGQDALARMLYADLKTWLVDDILIKADKMTMANSVELRVPFLDYRIVEFAATVPSPMKQRRGDVKWILKRAMAGRIPREVLTRPKTGFPTPLGSMFRQGLSEYLCDTLLSSVSRTRGFFRAPRIEQLIREHVAGQRDHHKLLWQLIVLEEWQRRFIDAPRRRQPVAPHFCAPAMA